MIHGTESVHFLGSTQKLHSEPRRYSSESDVLLSFLQRKLFAAYSSAVIFVKRATMALRRSLFVLFQELRNSPHSLKSLQIAMWEGLVTFARPAAFWEYSISALERNNCTTCAFFRSLLPKSWSVWRRYERRRVIELTPNPKVTILFSYVTAFYKK